MLLTDEPLSAYNLTVNHNHTYFVSGKPNGKYQAFGVWVHNDCFLGKPKQKASNASIGDILRTPTSHPSDFIKLRNGQGYRNKNTNEIWQKSKTYHSDKNGEWKVGFNGAYPEKGNKITVGLDGKYIKYDQ